MCNVLVGAKLFWLNAAASSANSLFSDEGVDYENRVVGVEGPCNRRHQPLSLLERHNRIHFRHDGPSSNGLQTL